VKQRLKKINRLIKVQQHLHQSEELRLANLQRHEAELKSAQEEVLQTMSDDDVLHGLFVDVLSKKLKSLAQEETRTQAALVTQKAVTFDKAMQVKRTEKMFSKLKVESRRVEEKKDLMAILEAITTKSGTSLP
jgi:hypothetical protein